MDGFGSSGHRFHTDIGGGGGRRCKSGWGSRHGGSEPKRPTGPPMKLEGKTYDEIKAQCLRENRLFEDPDFPAIDSSVFPNKRPPRPFEWKRPGVSSFALFYHKACTNKVHMIPKRRVLDRKVGGEHIKLKSLMCSNQQQQHRK